MTTVPTNPAEEAAAKAWAKLEESLRDGASFIFEAGAGAGKTYSLLQALEYLIGRTGRELIRTRQQIACITFTNVARDQILAYTDRHPAVYCETTHAFAWSLISGFQKQLRELLPQLPEWAAMVTEGADLSELKIEYALGRRAVEEGKALLHHNDIFPLTIRLLESAKFRNLLTSRFPIILIDEYQDTHASLMGAFEKHFFGKAGAPQFGLFGDHWQKIYGDGCGSVDHPSLARIDKGANFRSVKAVVDCLNRIRPSLKQVVKDPSAKGTVSVFHTNSWTGRRQTKNHWQGDLPDDEGKAAFLETKRILADEQGWDFAPKPTKILMLTHRVLANRQGYASLPKVYTYNDSFSRKSDDHIAFLIDHLEPAAEAFSVKRYGAMFEAIDARPPTFSSPAAKSVWANAMGRLLDLRKTGTVGDVISHLLESDLPILPEKLVKRESDLRTAIISGVPLDRRLSELKSLHAVPYAEIMELTKYHQGHSPFETKHGVKGEQFENVLVVFGRGWNDYDFNAFLEMEANPRLIASKTEDYERYRNLFYVVCSRPKTNLALLFTHKLSLSAEETLAKWFAESPARDIGRMI